MTLSDKLVEKLACPGCHAELEYLKEAERLACHACQITFQITDDIPMLEIDQAQKL
jgi:hypothetical protein